MKYTDASVHDTEGLQCMYVAIGQMVTMVMAQ